jgi:hypothetical protein
LKIREESYRRYTSIDEISIKVELRNTKSRNKPFHFPAGNVEQALSKLARTHLKVTYYRCRKVVVY